MPGSASEGRAFQVSCELWSAVPSLEWRKRRARERDIPAARLLPSGCAGTRLLASPRYRTSRPPRPWFAYSAPSRVSRRVGFRLHLFQRCAVGSDISLCCGVSRRTEWALRRPIKQNLEPRSIFVSKAGRAIIGRRVGARKVGFPYRGGETVRLVLESHLLFDKLLSSCYCRLCCR
jgi:hypothetical protein